MDISDLIGPWLDYRLSPDGKEFTLRTDRCEARFSRIRKMALLPASIAQQLELDKEVEYAFEYDLREHIISPLPANVERFDNKVEIGPANLRVQARTYSDERTTSLYGYYVGAEYFEVTLICERPVSLTVLTELPLTSEGSANT